jgi:conjugal transfer pilus assembly protein TraA
MAQLVSLSNNLETTTRHAPLWRKVDPVLVLTALLVLAALSGSVFAGTDTTFKTISDTTTGWINGSLGKMASIGALGIGLVTGIVRQSLMFVAVGVGLATAAFYGPTILSSIAAATL